MGRYLLGPDGSIVSGGNIGISEPLIVGLASDLTPPYVVSTGPIWDTSLDREPVTSSEIALSEPLNAESVRNDSLRGFTSGPDEQSNTPADVEVLGGTVAYRRQDNTVTLTFPEPLTAASYRARLEPEVRDRSGNQLDLPFEWIFSVVGPQVLSWVPRENGLSAGMSLEVLFRGPIDSASVQGKLSVTGSGPDGLPETADDVLVPGTTLHEPGSPLLRREFSPPLDPGGYMARWDRTHWNPMPIGFFTTRDGIGDELSSKSFESSGSTIASIGDALYVGGRFLFPSCNIGVWRKGGFDNSMGVSPPSRRRSKRLDFGTGHNGNCSGAGLNGNSKLETVRPGCFVATSEGRAGLAKGFIPLEIS